MTPDRFYLIPTGTGRYDLCELETGIVYYDQTLERIEQMIEYAETNRAACGVSAPGCEAQVGGGHRAAERVGNGGLLTTDAAGAGWGIRPRCHF